MYSPGGNWFHDLPVLVLNTQNFRCKQYDTLLLTAVTPGKAIDGSFLRGLLSKLMVV